MDSVQTDKYFSLHHDNIIINKRPAKQPVASCWGMATPQTLVLRNFNLSSVLDCLYWSVECHLPESVEVLKMRNSGEIRSRASRDGESGAHLSTHLGDHGDLWGPIQWEGNHHPPTTPFENLKKRMSVSLLQ